MKLLPRSLLILCSLCMCLSARVTARSVLSTTKTPSMSCFKLSLKEEKAQPCCYSVARNPLNCFDSPVASFAMFQVFMRNCETEEGVKLATVSGHSHICMNWLLSAAWLVLLRPKGNLP